MLLQSRSDPRSAYFRGRIDQARQTKFHAELDGGGGRRRRAGVKQELLRRR